MIFFTDEKLQNNTAHAEYEKYCKDNWNQFPDALKIIQYGQLPEAMLNGLDKISLHDSRITEFKQLGDILTIKLDADHLENLSKVNLKYIGVMHLEKPTENVLGTDIENPNSDVMCHEIMLNDNHFQHSFLFASNEQLTITFTEVELFYEDQ